LEDRAAQALPSGKMAGRDAVHPVHVKPLTPRVRRIASKTKGKRSAPLRRAKTRRILQVRLGTITQLASFFSQVFGGNDMTYEDPRTGRERNLGQDEASGSAGSLIVAIVLLAAIVLGGWYFYNRSENVANVNQTTPSSTSETTTTPPTSTADTNTTLSPQSSGPGIEGANGNKNGPAAKPSGSSTGASTGNTGVGNESPPANATVPSQDAKGVAGAPGNKNGPATNSPKPSDTPANNPAPAPSTNP
jgi:hypothetical protein